MSARTARHKEAGFGPAAEMASPGTFVRSEVRLIDADHFGWVASDGSWRAVFTRVGKS